MSLLVDCLIAYGFSYFFGFTLLHGSAILCSISGFPVARLLSVSLLDGMAPEPIILSVAFAATGPKRFEHPRRMPDQ